MASVRKDSAAPREMTDLLEPDHEPFPQDPDAPTPRRDGYTEAAE